MSESVRTALLFLIYTLFNLYLFILTIRIILVWVRADYFNPVTQFITKCTDFIVKPLRRIMPNIYKFETASFVLILIIEFIKFAIIALITVHTPNLSGIFVLILADTLNLFLETFFYTILLQAILSWFQPHSPLNYVLYQFTAPLMQPLRRWIPPVAGFDVTPVPALLILQLLIILTVNPLMISGWYTTVA